MIKTAKLPLTHINNKQSFTTGKNSKTIIKGTNT